MTLLVIDRLLHVSLADALHDAAMELTFHDHRIDQRAEIIDAGIVDEFDKAGLRIDLDFGDVAAIGIGRRARSVADVYDVE